jgi:hypothetical protein
MSDVNVVRKLAGTTLRDVINTFFFSFLCFSVQFGNLIVTLCMCACDACVCCISYTAQNASLRF